MINEKIFELKKYGCHLHELEYNKCKITDMPCSLNWCPIIYWVNVNKESSKQKNQRPDKQSPCPKSTE